MSTRVQLQLARATATLHKKVAGRSPELFVSIPLVCHTHAHP